MDGHHGREKRERRERGEARVTSGIKGSGGQHESQTPEGGMKKTCRKLYRIFGTSPSSNNSGERGRARLVSGSQPAHSGSQPSPAQRTRRPRVEVVWKRKRLGRQGRGGGQQARGWRAPVALRHRQPGHLSLVVVGDRTRVRNPWDPARGEYICQDFSLFIARPHR
jgi:hypothetical protein